MPAIEASLIRRGASAYQAGEGFDVLPWWEHDYEKLLGRPYQIDRRKVALDDLAYLSVQVGDACLLYFDDLAFVPCVGMMLLQKDRCVLHVPWA